jgi:hypothetical protein
MECAFARCQRLAGALTTALLLSVLSTGRPLSALAGSPRPLRGMPVLVPLSGEGQPLHLLRQLNRDTDFNVRRLARVAISPTGIVTEQYAVVDVVQRSAPFDPLGPFPLFVPADLVPRLRQLNGGADLRVGADFDTPVGDPARIARVAQVAIRQMDDSLARSGPLDLLLLVPARSLPALAQLNAGTTFDLLRIASLAASEYGPLTPLMALVTVHQRSGIESALQPFPLLVLPKDPLSLLNVGLRMQLSEIFPVALDPRDPPRPVALVHFTQDPEALGDLNGSE